MDATTHDLSRLLIELGLIVVSLAILARIASRWGFSAIPLYLLAGLAFGKGGLAPLNLSAGFTHIGAEIGVFLLLFLLGVKTTPPTRGTNNPGDFLPPSLISSSTSRLVLLRDSYSSGNRSLQSCWAV